MEFWEDVEILKSFFKLGPRKSQGFSEAVKKKSGVYLIYGFPWIFFFRKMREKSTLSFSRAPVLRFPAGFLKNSPHRSLRLVSACGVFSNSLRKKWPTVTSIYMGISLNGGFSPQIIGFLMGFSIGVPPF